MAVTKAKKIEEVGKLTEEFKGASHAIVGTFAKLTVEKDFELRKAVRGAGAHYRVVKNTLAERAAKGTAVEEAMKDLAGVTSTYGVSNYGWCEGDWYVFGGVTTTEIGRAHV